MECNVGWQNQLAVLVGKTNKKNNNICIYTSLKAYTAGLPWWSSS